MVVMVMSAPSRGPAPLIASVMVLEMGIGEHADRSTGDGADDSAAYQALLGCMTAGAKRTEQCEDNSAFAQHDVSLHLSVNFRSIALTG